MRTIEHGNKFKKDYKRESTGRYKTTLQKEFIEVITTLSNDQPLDARYRDHEMYGNWKNHRDCHIKPDLVLIYTRPDDKTLMLVRLGSHSELSI
jgi:mRNA interferase YafQ